ncbi:hypothetical protein [Nocardia terpenica]|uniref:Mce-associated membrane protein n=1 Tax=Nocardia terpenica TaxID=455432 RepID=A0A291RIX1_9NOCA|nr:hypothetical protein [Nocardia terpenica]ATL67228.1 hypothetical protein CRH09_14515 [Nocardia terpenica]
MTVELDRTEAHDDSIGESPVPAGWSRWIRSAWVTRLLVAAVVVLLVLSALLTWWWHRDAQQLKELRQHAADSNQAADIAKDYATKSLTYDFHHLDAFFDSVRTGTTGALSDRYNTVHDTLSKIMTEAQVVAHGDVAATAVSPNGNGIYSVTVFATQTTQNVQHPDPVTASTLLTVTVQHTDGRWLVSDYHAR